MDVRSTKTLSYFQELKFILKPGLVKRNIHAGAVIGSDGFGFALRLTGL
jgi:hypothetical protein